jgi:hypothetical protein
MTLGMAEFTEGPASDITIQDLCTGPLWDHEQNDLLKRHLCDLVTLIESTKPVDFIELEDADIIGRAYLKVHTHTSPRSEPHWSTVISGTPFYARFGEAKNLMRWDATVHTGRRKLAALLSDVSGIICERLSARYGTGLQAESTATEAETAMTVAVEEIDLRDANNLRKRCRDAIEG